MSSRPLLRLTDDLLEVLEAPGGFEVVPVLVEDLGSHLEALTVLVRHAGGMLIAAQDVSMGTKAVADPPFEAVVADVLSRAAVGTVTLAHPTADEIVPLLDGQTADKAMNTGAPTMLGAAAALFDADIRQAAFAAIAYEEASLDIEIQEALWDLFTIQLPGIGSFGITRKLFVLVGTSATDPSRHCRAGLSARFRLGAERADRRRKWADDRYEIEHLELGGRPYFVLFLGAGFSASSRLPLGNSLRDWALRTMHGKDGEQDALVLADRFMNAVVSKRRQLVDERFTDPATYLRDLTLERVLREERTEYLPDEMPTLREFHRLNARALLGRGPAVNVLRGILAKPQLRQRLFILTVNFDTLLEEGIGDLEVFSSEDEFARFPDYFDRFVRTPDRVPLLKLHGSIKEPASIVANVDDTMPGLAPNRASAVMKLLELGRANLAYVGYSMRDLDLGPLLGQRAFAQVVEETWVSPFPDSAVANFAGRYRASYWAEAKVRGYEDRTITQTADVFMRELISGWALP